ncbi:hypothetical protein HK097_000903, partial [Rhizophlyctis rosea]
MGALTSRPATAPATTTTDSEAGTGTPYTQPPPPPASRSIFTEASGTYFGPHFVVDPYRLRPGRDDSDGILSGFWSEIRNLVGVGGGATGIAEDPYRGVELSDAEIEGLARMRTAAGETQQSPTQTLQQTTTLQLLVNLKKNSIRLHRLSSPPTVNPLSTTAQPQSSSVSHSSSTSTLASSPSTAPNSKSHLHRLEFSFDSTTECRIRIHYLVKEVVAVGDGSRRIVYRSKDNTHPKTQTFGPFPAGLNQRFTLPDDHLLDARTFTQEDFIALDSAEAERGEAVDESGRQGEAGELAGTDGNREGETRREGEQEESQAGESGSWRLAGPIVYPVVVVVEALEEGDAGEDEQRGPLQDVLAAESVTDGSAILTGSDPPPSPSPHNSQSTFATLIPGSDGALELKVVKQKAMIQSTPFLLQEIYGFTDPSSSSSNLADEDLQSLRDCV